MVLNKFMNQINSFRTKILGMIQKWIQHLIITK